MKNILTVAFAALAMLFAGCSKWNGEHHDISTYVSPPAHPISDAAPLCGSIKGTMLAGKTYILGCDVTINAGDTLIIQPGVTIYADRTAKSGVIVQGTLLSLGTRTNPITFTVKGVKKTDAVGVNSVTDSAYYGFWKGIMGGPSCPLMVFKWTHIDFAGAAYGTAGAAVGQVAKTSFSMLFQNYKGVFVFEDSWLYGATDDAMRISNGKIAVFRSTFEKCGPAGGDCVNVKGGTVGTMAYNFFIGTATNAQKASNKGAPVGSSETNIVMYNGTFVSCGWRSSADLKGANINYEEGASGMFYNNVNVNCRVGFRVVGNPPADFANLKYGYNFNYGDNLHSLQNIYPLGNNTQPQPTDIPTPSSFLPANYALGDPISVASVTPLIGANNPMFVNFPLPIPSGTNAIDYSAIGNFDFHLQASSPLRGKGYTAVVPLIVVPIDPNYGLTEATPPGADLGCYQFNGTGNQH
ncbi:hypothetical protein [Mucilaginibacter paludis]|uniref:Lipoprotein n=1 Tax=Mucilaginibacter paludis DSM 18603 TaxID=714943 RepID=H1YEL3_9SPHI|nr:hypothetical protein [Mucilaginibacter paludis]EHQ30773.1 hypothetical protein Mucpa_6723 [Mucilaginibacter paludis DSM 18603]